MLRMTSCVSTSFSLLVQAPAVKQNKSLRDRRPKLQEARHRRLDACMEKLKSRVLELWNYALLMYRKKLIRAESRRRKAIRDTDDWNRKSRKANLVSDDNHSEFLENHIIIKANVQDPIAATIPCKEIFHCDRLEMKRVFDLFDKDKDGVISAKELQLHMKRLGFDLSDQKIRDMVGAVGSNSDDYVEFEEFFSLYSSPGEGSSPASPIGREDDEMEETLLKAFFLFDENMDGFICRLELQQVLLKLGLPEGRSLIRCQKMIENVDADGNGKVDFFEFKRLMR